MIRKTRHRRLRPFRHVFIAAIGLAPMLQVEQALADGPAASPETININAPQLNPAGNVPQGSAVPSQSGGQASGSTFAQTNAGTGENAKIDALRLRAVVNTPSVTDTIFGNIGNWRGSLADYGIGVNGLLSGGFATQITHLPQTTYGTHRYIGQQPEFDSSNSYLLLTYDLGHVGMKDGLLTLQDCENASDQGQYPHGNRFCAFYVDQPLLNKMIDIQAGWITNSNQYANPLVGGSVASGSLGPSASILTEMGLAASGTGAPAVNIAVNLGHIYDRAGVQRSISPSGLIYESQVANPYGIRFTERGQGVLWLDELGYRVLSAPGHKNTWARAGVMYNSTEYSSLLGKGKQPAIGMYALADHQFTQFDRLNPRRGIYVGASYMYASPEVVTYSQYFEARAYGVGILPNRPRDQLSFIASSSLVSQSAQEKLIRAHYGAAPQVFNFTLVYTYRVTTGVYFTGGFNYSVHPSTYYNHDEGNPVILRGVLVLYL